MNKPMDAESIVKAMEDAGVTPYFVHDTEEPVKVGAFGSLEAWSRFRGVPLDEVAKTLDELIDLFLEYRDCYDHPEPGARALAVSDIMEGLRAKEDIAQYEREVRGGD